MRINVFNFSERESVPVTYSSSYVLPAVISASLLLAGCNEDGTSVAPPDSGTVTVPSDSAPINTPAPITLPRAVDSVVIPPKTSAAPVAPAVDNKAVTNTPFIMAGAISSNTEQNFNITNAYAKNTVTTDWLLNRFKTDNLNSAVFHFHYNLNTKTDTFSRPTFDAPDLSWGTPTWDSMDSAGARAVKAGLKPVFYMTVFSLPDSFSSLLANNYVPSNPDAFFASYKDTLLHVAELSQKYDSPYMNIGTELGPVATDSKYLPYWEDIISSVRKIYTGKLTYSSYVDDRHNYNTELLSVTFKDKLDMLGMNIYPQTLDNGELNGTYDQFYNEWKTSIVPSLNKLIAELKMPTFISEFGISRVDGAGSNALWGTDAGKPYDFQEQADLFDAALRAINEGLNIKGMVLWGSADGISMRNGAIDTKDSYTNNWVGEIAESVIQKWAEKFVLDTGGGNSSSNTSNTTVDNTAPPPPTETLVQRMIDLVTPDNLKYGGGGGGSYASVSIDTPAPVPVRNWYDDFYVDQGPVL